MSEELLLTELRREFVGVIKAYYRRNTRLGRGIVLHHQANEITDELLAKVLKAGYVKPPESMRLTELAEVLYNFMKGRMQNYNTIKANIQNFLLANHYLLPEEVEVKIVEAKKQEIAKIRTIYKEANDLKELEKQIKEYLDNSLP